MTPEIKKNIDVCKEIINGFKELLKSKATGPAKAIGPDIYFLIDELKTKTEWLKTLYKQIP